MRLVLARRPNPASSRGAAAPPALSLPESDAMGSADSGPRRQRRRRRSTATHPRLKEQRGDGGRRDCSVTKAAAANAGAHAHRAGTPIVRHGALTRPCPWSAPNRLRRCSAPRRSNARSARHERRSKLPLALSASAPRSSSECWLVRTRRPRSWTRPAGRLTCWCWARGPTGQCALRWWAASRLRLCGMRRVRCSLRHGLRTPLNEPNCSRSALAQRATRAIGSQRVTAISSAGRVFSGASPAARRGANAIGPGWSRNGCNSERVWVRAPRHKAVSGSVRAEWE
jgi:hypothetical protein